MQRPFLRVPEEVRVMGLARLERPLTPGNRGHFDNHFALAREFYGIADEVHQDLPQPGDVAYQDLWNRIVDQVTEIQVLFGGFRSKHVQGFLDAGAKLERMVL